MATHKVAHDELSPEHSNGPPAKHYAKIMSQTSRRKKRARMMSDSGSDGDTGVHLHDVPSASVSLLNSDFV